MSLNQKIEETNCKKDKQEKNRKIKFECFLLLPKWCVILSVILSVGLLIVMIATAVLLFYFQIPALYTEKCSSRPCSRKLGLKCLDGECLCNKNEFYQKGCKLKKSYLISCNDNSSDCLDNAGLLCSSGRCVCDSFSYWNGTSCMPKQIYGSRCQRNNEECFTTAFLYCDVKSFKCLCPLNR